ncbi:PREDICTED: rho-related GTP-binding protein RhoV [Charadrius vociferus]|nr:PREDICTED: rho-related GTP-binding protein RhoV [Charadrius vociferus]
MRPAGQRLYLDFFSVSPDITGSGLLWHLRSDLAPLSIQVPTQLPQWVIALLPVFIVPPSFFIVLCFLTVQVLVDGAPVRIQLWDTAGQEDFDCLRSLCYPDTDVFLVCFSVVNPSSFQNITEKWIPEIRTHNPRAPVLLVGTQADLRDDVNVLISLDRYHVKPVPRPQAEGLADKIRAEAYLECSALTQKNLKEVFDMAIVSGVEHKARQEKKMTAKGIKTLSKCRWKKFFCFV